jgi:molybdenum cofactor guanylyltransferase
LNADAESFVIAGGRSSRMGRDKAQLQVRGESLVEIALRKLRSLHGPAPRIAGGNEALSRYAPLVVDKHPGCGPLSGIEAALAASARSLNVFLPVDMPFLPAQFLAWMLKRATITGALVTVPRIGGLPQPLCAIYHRDLLTPIAAALDAGDFKVMPVVIAASHGSTDTFDTERVIAADGELLTFSSLPVHQWFHNCNTPDDMAVVENALVLSP